MTFDGVRKLALTFPGVEEGTSYGTPAFRAGGKLIARMLDDGKSMVVKVDLEDREVMVNARPQAFSVTPHYQNYPMVVVRLSKVRKGELEELLRDAWREVAPKKHIRAFDSK